MMRLVYVSALMYSPDPSKIPAEFNNRDRIGNSDFFMLMINPNDDGQNPTMIYCNSSWCSSRLKSIYR